MFEPWTLPAAFFVDEDNCVRKITHLLQIPGEALVVTVTAPGEMWVDPIHTILECTIFADEEAATKFAAQEAERRKAAAEKAPLSEAAE